MSNLLLLLSVPVSFGFFLVAWIIISKKKFKEEKEILVKNILQEEPSVEVISEIRNLGQESSIGWMWNPKAVEKLSYNELLDLCIKLKK